MSAIPAGFRQVRRQWNTHTGLKKELETLVTIAPATKQLRRTVPRRRVNKCVTTPSSNSTEISRVHCLSRQEIRRWTDRWFCVARARPLPAPPFPLRQLMQPLSGQLVVRLVVWKDNYYWNNLCREYKTAKHSQWACNTAPGIVMHFTKKEIKHNNVFPQHQPQSGER